MAQLCLGQAREAFFTSAQIHGEGFTKFINISFCFNCYLVVPFLVLFNFAVTMQVVADGLLIFAKLKSHLWQFRTMKYVGQAAFENVWMDSSCLAHTRVPDLSDVPELKLGLKDLISCIRHLLVAVAQCLFKTNVLWLVVHEQCAVVICS